MIKKQDWISVPEAEQRTGLTGGFIRRLARDKRINAKRVAAIWLIDPSSLDQYMRSPRKPGPKPLDN